jgi:hypothetical protein
MGAAAFMPARMMMIPAMKIRIRVGSERDESVVMGRFRCLIHPFHRIALKTGWLAGIATLDLRYEFS